MLGWLGRGALLGAAWGCLARGFMRLLSDEPAFTWSGTLTIVGLATGLGALLGLVRGARLAGRTRWWRLVPIPGLILFAGPGILLLPASAGAMVAARFRRPSVRTAWLVLGLAGALYAAVAIDLREVTWSLAPGIGLYLVSALLLGLGMAEWTRPWPASRGPEDRTRGWTSDGVPLSHS